MASEPCAFLGLPTKLSLIEGMIMEKFSPEEEEDDEGGGGGGGGVNFVGLLQSLLD